MECWVNLAKVIISRAGTVFGQRVCLMLGSRGVQGAKLMLNQLKARDIQHYFEDGLNWKHRIQLQTLSPTLSLSFEHESWYDSDNRASTLKVSLFTYKLNMYFPNNFFPSPHEVRKGDLNAPLSFCLSVRPSVRSLCQQGFFICMVSLPF